MGELAQIKFDPRHTGSILFSPQISLMAARSQRPEASNRQSPERGAQMSDLWPLVVALSLGELDAQLISPLLAEIAGDLRAGVAATGSSVALYSTCSAFCALFLAPLSDRKGRLRFLRYGLLLLALAALAAAAAHSLAWYFAARALAGAAAGLLSAVAIAYAADLFPFEQRGRAMGLLSLAYFAPPIIGVPACSALAARAGWRTVYLAIGLGALLLCFFSLIRWPAPEIRGESHSVISTYLGFLRERAARIGLATGFFFAGGPVAFLTYVGGWLRREQGRSVEEIGLIFLAAGLASFVAAPLAGQLSDRMSKRRLAAASNAALAAGLLGAARAGWGTLFFALAAFIGIAAALRVAPLNALVTELVAAEKRGAYVALRNAAAQLGIAIAVLASAYLYRAAGFQAVAWFAAAFVLLETAAILLLKESIQPSAVSKAES